MKRLIFIALSLSLSIVLSLAGAASAVTIKKTPNIVQNGDFETGDFSGWTVFQTVNGVTNEAVETFRMYPAPLYTYAASFVMGSTAYSSPSGEWEGGGIYQSFEAPEGTWAASVDIAAKFMISGFPVPSNTPLFEVLIDGNVVGSYQFERDYLHYAPCFRLIATGSFSTSGMHDIKIRITSPRNYFKEWIDNVKFQMVPTMDGQVLQEYGGHYYLVVPEAGTWEEANLAASVQVAIDENPFQGHLATISSPEENAFIYDLIVNKSGAGGRGWIGGCQLPDQASVSDGWEWVTGESMSYTNWDPARGDSPIPSPNDAGGPDSGDYIGRPWGPDNNYGYPYYGLEDNGENFMEMRGDGYWDDLGGSIGNSSYVIEFEPVIDLIADGGDNPTYIGDLHVSYADETFNIEYIIEPPWELVKTHVYIGNEPPSKSSPGQFPYTAGSIPITIGVDPVFIAAHADIRMQTGVDENSNPVYTYESAWAQDLLTNEPIGKGANWATFFEYNLILP